MHSSKRHNENRGTPVHNKIFIGGLSQSTTQESLSKHFQQFGTVDAIVMMDKATGRSRGFGFCTFATPEAAQAALAAPQTVDDKAVECSPCWAKSIGKLESKSFFKIFVGALTQTTTAESLHQHFSQYGDCEAVVMMDKVTGRPRGFGFCTFAEHESLLGALSQPQSVEGKTVDCKVCAPKGEVLSYCKPNRIFVGGLPQTVDEAKLREFFSRYGTISEARIMTDKESSRSRGFGYVTFHSAQSCELALANKGSNTIDEKWVEVKRCIDKVVPSKDGASQALAQLSPHQLTQVANLTNQLQNILGQPLMQVLQSQISSGPNPSPNGKSGKASGHPKTLGASLEQSGASARSVRREGKNKGDSGAHDHRGHASR
jgi:RNA recognition motif-containing protein